MYAIADKILENGMMIISFDGPAHGLSKGKTTTPKEFIETIEFLSSTYGPFEAAIGHSFGSISLLKSVSNMYEATPTVLFVRLNTSISF